MNNDGIEENLMNPEIIEIKADYNDKKESNDILRNDFENLEKDNIIQNKENNINEKQDENNFEIFSEKNENNIFKNKENQDADDENVIIIKGKDNNENKVEKNEIKVDENQYEK